LYVSFNANCLDAFEQKADNYKATDGTTNFWPISLFGVNGALILLWSISLT